jgi:hypothetical protein
MDGCVRSRWLDIHKAELGGMMAAKEVISDDGYMYNALRLPIYRGVEGHGIDILKAEGARARIGNEEAIPDGSYQWIHA